MFKIIFIIILGFGISLSVTANVILNSGEAFVKAISDTTHKEFGNVKIAFDVTCVILAVVLPSFLALEFIDKAFIYFFLRQSSDYSIMALVCI